MENDTRAQLRFFSSMIIVLSIIYIFSWVIAIFSLEISLLCFSLLILVLFFIAIIQDAIKTKTEAVCGEDSLSFTTFPIITMLTVLVFFFCIVLPRYYEHSRSADTVFAAAVALIVSPTLDRCLRALRKLKHPNSP